MRSMSLLQKQTYCRRFGVAKIVPYIQYPLADKDIISLQALFTTPGCHAIEVADVQAGRLLITRLLKSLKYHHEIGFVTDSQFDVCAPAVNITSILAGVQDQEQIVSFFLNEFYYDFIWIEVTSYSDHMAWFHDFYTELINFNIQQMIPVILVFYR